MRNRIVFMLVLLFTAGSAFLAGFGIPPQERRNLLRFFPDTDASGEWRKSREPEHFWGDDLYTYIDGGAEIFLEYGFRQVAVQDYAGASEKSLTVEVYEMRDSEAAFGIFTFARGEGGAPADIGWESHLESYYLIFCQGPYFVTVTGFDKDSETVRGILQVARVLEENLSAETREARPDSIRFLPEKDLIPSSLKVFRGPLGLANSYTFAMGDVFEVEKGLRARYSSGHELFLLVYDSESRCRAIHTAAWVVMSEDERYGQSGRSGASAWLKDRDGRLIVMRPAGKILAIVLDAEDLEAADRILSSVSEKPPSLSHPISISSSRKVNY